MILAHLQLRIVIFTVELENTIDTGLYLRCNIGKSNIKDNNWNIALGSGNFKDCTISNKSGENMGGTYENCSFENIRGNIHGTF